MNQYSTGIFSYFLLLMPSMLCTCCQTNEVNAGNISDHSSEIRGGYRLEDLAAVVVYFTDSGGRFMEPCVFGVRESSTEEKKSH